MRKAITVSILLLTTLLFGQEEPLRLQSLTGGEAAISYEMWKAGEDRISEWAFPVSLVMPVNARLQFWTRTAPAFATLASGVSYSLGGLSDILVGGHWLTMSDHLLVHFGMNLPAGRTGLSTEEYSVASVLSRPVFNFNVPEMGQGFDLHLGVNGAIQLGEFTAGAGLSYLLKGGFKPFEDYDGVYDPGDEWSVTLGLERETYIGDTPLKFIGDMLYTSYGTDLWMDGPVYRSGSRLLAQVQAILSLVKM
jgi:hypothetical protein